MSVESPSYEIVEAGDGVELRRYAPYVRANVRVAARDHNDAAMRGFGALADYIFGNNRESGSIAMAVPVTAEREGTRIAMTAPVTSERERESQLAAAQPVCTVRCPGEYVVSFTMPSRYGSIDELPVPNNPAVELEEIPEHLAVVEPFGGRLSDELVARHTAHARQWMAERGLGAQGEPVAAQFDAPWKPGFARHNEVIIRVK